MRRIPAYARRCPQPLAWHAHRRPHRLLPRGHAHGYRARSRGGERRRAHRGFASVRCSSTTCSFTTLGPGCGCSKSGVAISARDGCSSITSIREVIDECLRHVVRIMAPGRFFDFTFHPTARAEHHVLREDFHYRPETLVNLAARYGLHAHLMEDWERGPFAVEAAAHSCRPNARRLTPSAGRGH
jgi:hypothetical protein